MVWRHQPFRIAFFVICLMAMTYMMFHWTMGLKNSSLQYGIERLSSTQISPSPIEAEFIKRREEYMNACLKTPKGRMSTVFVHKSSHLSVCYTAKIGCTFWKRIMTFLHSPNNTWKSPFEVDRFAVHHQPSMHYEHSLSKNSTKELISNFNRVVFARDPYRRLWSVYVDKIVLPDSWQDFGLGIARYRNLGEMECPLNITFEDFLHFAVYKHMNNHWSPVHLVCDPCSFLPQYVGKMESFSQDTVYILNKSGLGYLLADHDSHKHVVDELLILIDYHFKIHFSRKINQQCLTVTTLAGRLWRAFQLNGYISLNETFPETRVQILVQSANSRTSSELVSNLFADYYRRNPRTKSQIKTQREQVLRNHYRNIPLRLKEDIRALYENDFKLFGYESTPGIVFSQNV